MHSFKRSNPSTSQDTPNKRANVGVSGMDISREKMRLNNLISTNSFYTGVSDLAKYAVKVTLNGDTSSGKSSLANRIISTEILPIGAETVTMIPQKISTALRVEDSLEFEVEWTYDSKTTQEKLKKNIGTLPPSSVKFARAAEVADYMRSVFSCYEDEDYSDLLKVKRFVENPTYFHVLDVPGNGSLNRIRHLMTEDPTPINVVVIGFKKGLFKAENGIFSDLTMANSGASELNLLLVLNMVDNAVESKKCLEKECDADTRCETCMEYFGGFMTTAVHIYKWCKKIGIPFFLAQSASTSTRYTEEQNIKFILANWAKNPEHVEMGRYVRCGVSAIHDEIYRRSTEPFNVKVYEDMVDILRTENNRDEEDIHMLTDSRNGLASKLNLEFLFGADIIRSLEEKFIDDNLERTVKITDPMSYKTGPKGIQAGDLKSDEPSADFTGAPRASHGDRYPIVVMKHMIASDRLVDDTMEQLARSSLVMADSIFKGFEDKLYAFVDRFQPRLPGKEDGSKPKEDEISTEIKSHWSTFRKTQRCPLADIIRTTFMVSKHAKEKPFDVQKDERKKAEQIEKLRIEIESSKSDEQKERSIFSIVSGMLAIARFRTPQQSIVDDTLKSLIDNPKYFSIKSHFHRDEIYRMAIEDLERCIGQATKCIFSHVTECLVVNYPAEMMNRASLFNYNLSIRNKERVAIIRERMSHREETCKQICTLIEHMSE